MNSILGIGVAVMVLGRSAAYGQECRPRAPDTATVWATVDYLNGGEGAPASQRSVAFETIGVDGTNGCSAVTVIHWDGHIGGGLLIRNASGATQYRADYRDPANVRAAGRDRLLVEYEFGRSSGYRERRVVVLCSLGTQLWATCLDLEKSRQELIESEDSGGQALELAFDAQVELNGDSLLAHRRVRWRTVSDTTSGPWTSRDLGLTVLMLPSQRTRAVR